MRVLIPTLRDETAKDGAPERFWRVEGGSRLRTNAHLSDDKTVAKMGHPALVEMTILVAG